MSYQTVYPVVDCRDHPQSALLMPSRRRFCFVCGLEVVPDLISLGELDTLPADDVLKAEARDAWNSSSVIRQFAANCQAGATPLTTKVAR